MRRRLFASRRPATIRRPHRPINGIEADALPQPSATAAHAQAQAASKPSLELPRLWICGACRWVPRPLGGRRLLAVEGLEGPPRLREPREVRAAGDDAHPRAQRRAHRRVRARAAHLRADQHDPQAPHRGVPFGRGPALLRTRRRRFPGHRARRLQARRIEARRQVAARRRRLDHHPAGGEELSSEQRALDGAQDQGSDPRHPHRARLLEGPHSRALSQRDLPRHGRLWRRGREHELFQQGAAGSHHRGGGLPRGAAEGAQQLPPVPPDQGGANPAQLDHRPDAGERLRQGG